MARPVDSQRILLVLCAITGSTALGSFVYYLVIRSSSPFAGVWAVLSGIFVMTSGLLNLAILLRAPSLRDAPSLRIATIASVPCPLILWGLALTGIGFNSDLVLVLGGGAAVCVFLIGFGLYIRHLAVSRDSR